MIKEIVIRDLKGNNVNQPLTGKDIFCGKNGAGKSSRLEAVAISLLGYIPGQGKKPEETFKYASDKSMKVGLVTDKEFEFDRTFDKKIKDGKASISQSISLSPSLGEKTGKDKEARIIDEIGNFPIMLDFNEFLSLTDSKRRDFFYSLSQNFSGWDKHRVSMILDQQLLNLGLEEDNAELFEVMKGCLEQTLKQYPERFDIQQGLTAMLEYSKDKLSYWKSEKETAEGAVSKLAELKNLLTETDRNIVENKSELEKLQGELIKVEKELSSTYEKKKAINSRNDKISILEKEIAAIEIKKPNGSEFDIKAKIAENESKLKNHNYAIEISNSKEASRVLNAELEVITGKMNEAHKISIELQGEKKSLEAALTAINETQGKCVINSLIKCDKDFTKFIEAKKSRIDELSISIVTEEKKRNDLKKQADDLKVKIGQEEVLRENSAKAERYQVTTNDLITKTNNDLKLKLNDIQGFERYKELRIESKKKELETLLNTPMDVIAPTDILEIQKNALNAKIPELKKKIEEQERSRTTLSNQKSASIDVKVAEYNVECFKQLVAALGLKGIQGEIVKEMLDPIKVDIQENLRLMGLNNEFFFQMESDSGREVFQFGWVNEKGFTVNFDTLNNAHKSILLVAILTAIVEKANPKLKVLAIDDVEHIIDELFEEFIKGLNAIAHKWDNILLAVANSTLEVEGFKVWNLSKAV